MHKIPTPQAKQLAAALRALGVEVEMEHWDGYKHVDLFLPRSGIQIEVDGRQHLVNPDQILRDMKRSHYSDSDGYGTIHIQNEDIKTNLEQIASAVAEASRVQEVQRTREYRQQGLNEKKQVRHEFKAQVWKWPGMAAWHFVTVDAGVAQAIKQARAGSPRVGWGSIPVSVTIGKTTWKTSLFPDKKSGSYLLPVKAQVRKKEDISTGDTISISLSL